MRLGELIDIQVLSRLAEANFRASGMPIGIVDAVDGSILVGVGWQEICVAYHRVHPITAERCRESDDHIKQNLSSGEPCEYRCRNGLRDIGVPIVVAGTHLATLFMGQFFYDQEAPDREAFAAQARAFGFDEAAYLRALDRVPSFPRKTIENILVHNTALARFISEVAGAVLAQREASAVAGSLMRFPAENPDPIMRVSADGTVLYANPAALRRLDPLTVAEGGPCPPALAGPASRALAGNAPVAAEVRCADDTFAFTFVPAGGNVNVYGHEVTSRSRAEEALRRSEAQARAQSAQLEAILNCVADGVIVYDAEGRTIRSTPSADAILGVPPGERAAPIHERVARQYEILSEDGRRLAPTEMAAYRASVRGETIRGEVVNVRTAGKDPRWLRMNATPLLVDGRHTGAVLSFSDVTERKVAEEVLRRQELVVQHSRDVILFVRRDDGRILEANAAAEAVYGYTRAELLARAIGDLRASETRAELDGQMARAGDAGLLFESVHRRKDGSTFPVEVSARGVTVHGTRALISVVRDITERKRAQDAVRASEERFRALADNIAQLAWMADATGAITWYNRRWLDYTGTTEEEVRGWGWRKVQHPDHLERVASTWRDCLARGVAWEDTFPLRSRDGEFRWFLSRAVPIRDERGAVVRWFGTNTDVTEQRATAEALREADRRKDEFLAMLSHELRNPLAPIVNAIHLLRRGGVAGERAARAHAMIERQANHLTRLVDDLLDVTRIARGKIRIRRERVDLRELVLRAAEDFRAAIEERGVSFRVEVPPAPVAADADPTRVTQVIGNLLSNAAKVTEAGEEITVRLAVTAGAAAIVVRDTGSGIDPALLPRVFDPFVQGETSLARTEGGLGLGLALVKAIVELHGGTVRVESAGPGTGAEFEVALPVAADPAQRPAPEAGARGRRARKVLVVDDNVDAAESLADLVRLLGHEVEVAFDGPSAIRSAAASPPDVVLCDIGLPGMDGYAVAQAIRAGGCDGRLVAVTGYAQPEDVKRAAAAGFDGHVPKPPDPAVLERLLG